MPDGFLLLVLVLLEVRVEFAQRLPSRSALRESSSSVLDVSPPEEVGEVTSDANELPILRRRAMLGRPARASQEGAPKTSPAL